MEDVDMSPGNTPVERLVRIETKLDAFLRTQNDHEIRIRTVEGWRSRIIGMAAAVSLLIAFLKDRLFHS